MFRSVAALSLMFAFAPSAMAKPNADTSLLMLCSSFGETTKECRCYLNEVKKVYAPADVELAGGVARAFMNGEEPEAIAAYLLMTRKMTVTRANALYKLGDPHTRRVGRLCEDPNQVVTPAMKAKRGAMEARLEKIGARYRVGPKRN